MSSRSTNAFNDPIQLSRSNSDLDLAGESMTNRALNRNAAETKGRMFSGKVMPKTYSYTKEVVYRIKKEEKKNSRNSLVVKGSYWFKVMTIIRIQSLARRYLVRKIRAIENEKAIVIQRAFRYYLSLTIRETDLRKIVVVQNLYRTKCARRKLDNMKSEIIQQYLRRRMRLSRTLAAIQIQSLFRGYYSKKRFTAQKTNAIVIQKVYADYLMRKHTKKYIQGIILIQSVHRKRQAMRELEHMKTIIVKEYLQRKKQNSDGNVFRKSSQLFISQKRADDKVDEMKYSEFLFKYVVCLQTFFRGYLARETIKRQNARAAVIQRAWRNHLRRKQNDKLKLQVTVIQRAYRDHLRQKRLREQALERLRSATAIQRVYRGHGTRKARDQQLRSIVLIQSLAMSYIVRLRLRMRHSRATLIQSVHRQSVASARYLHILKGVVLIQSNIRYFLLRKKIASNNPRAVIIQRVYRGYASRANHREKVRNCILVQSMTRGFMARKYKLAMLTKIVLVQSTWRKKMAARNAEELRRNLENRSCTRIQSQWRCYNSKRNYLRFLSSIVTIQSFTRRYLAFKCAKRRKREKDFFNIHLFQLSNCTGENDVELCLDAIDDICFCDSNKKLILPSRITV